jgi:LPXTG-site transpeptidase (sortase) family protein
VTTSQAAPVPSFPSLLPPRPDPVLDVVGPATGAVEARPVAPETMSAPTSPPVAESRFPWAPVLFILVVAAALVGVIFLIARAALSSGTKITTNLPGVPPLPSWALLAALVVIGALVWGGYALVNSPVSDDNQGERRGWRALLDSRIIGTLVAAIFLGAAWVSINTPGGTPDIREIPGEVSGAIQSAVARPEPGYPRIRIKKVGIDLLLVKGDGKTPPVKYEAFTYPNADHLLADQGTPGNSYVYAHARDGMFWNLHNLSIGDVVEIDYGGGKIYRYRVSELHKSVNWKDFSWLQPTGDDRLTLQTCNGWRDDDPRFIVVAHRIADNPTALAR